MSGIILVTLPIGNIKDITLRALDALSSVNVIFAEDTRVFRKTASDLGIDLSNKNINSFHDHSESYVLDNLMKLALSQKIAFVSDAGSPVISDPGYPIILKALELDIPIYSIGGVSAVNYALELSALPATPFHFHGFIARDGAKKTEGFELFNSQYGTHIFFEGVSRVLKTLDEVTSMFPQNSFAVVREITKEFESVYRFKGHEFSSIKDSIVEKGEFVILMNNPNKTQFSDPKILELAHEIIAKGSKPKLVSKLISQITGESSKMIYDKIKL